MKLIDHDSDSSRISELASYIKALGDKFELNFSVYLKEQLLILL
jgi:hypothetical protein